MFDDIIINHRHLDLPSTIHYSQLFTIDKLLN